MPYSCNHAAGLLTFLPLLLVFFENVLFEHSLYTLFQHNNVGMFSIACYTSIPYNNELLWYLYFNGQHMFARE